MSRRSVSVHRSRSCASTLLVLLAAACGGTDDGPASTPPAPDVTVDTPSAPASVEAAVRAHVSEAYGDDEVLEVRLRSAPVPAGAALIRVDTGETVATAGAESWLAVADPQPFDGMGHALRYFVIDGATSAVTELEVASTLLVGDKEWVFRVEGESDVLFHVFEPETDVANHGLATGALDLETIEAPLEGEGKRRALIVKSSDEDWTVADAENWKKLAKKLGFPDEDVTVADKPPKADDLKKAIDAACEGLGPADKLMLAVSGHGRTDQPEFRFGTCAHGCQGHTFMSYADLAAYLRDHCAAGFVNVAFAACGSGAAHPAFQEAFADTAGRVVNVITATDSGSVNSHHAGKGGNLFFERLLHWACAKEHANLEALDGKVPLETVEAFFSMSDADWATLSKEKKAIRDANFRSAWFYARFLKEKGLAQGTAFGTLTEAVKAEVKAYIKDKLASPTATEEAELQAAYATSPASTPKRSRAGDAKKCISDADCDDGDPCTADICNAAKGCDNPPIRGGPECGDPPGPCVLDGDVCQDDCADGTHCDAACESCVAGCSASPDGACLDDCPNGFQCAPGCKGCLAVFKGAGGGTVVSGAECTGGVSGCESQCPSGMSCHPAECSGCLADSGAPVCKQPLTPDGPKGAVCTGGCPEGWVCTPDCTGCVLAGCHTGLGGQCQDTCPEGFACDAACSACVDDAVAPPACPTGAPCVTPGAEVGTCDDSGACTPETVGTPGLFMVMGQTVDEGLEASGHFVRVKSESIEALAASAVGFFQNSFLSPAVIVREEPITGVRAVFVLNPITGALFLVTGDTSVVAPLLYHALAKTLILWSNIGIYGKHQIHSAPEHGMAPPTPLTKNACATFGTDVHPVTGQILAEVWCDGVPEVHVVDPDAPGQVTSTVMYGVYSPAWTDAGTIVAVQPVGGCDTQVIEVPLGEGLTTPEQPPQVIVPPGTSPIQSIRVERDAAGVATTLHADVITPGGYRIVSGAMGAPEILTPGPGPEALGAPGGDVRQRRATGPGSGPASSHMFALAPAAGPAPHAVTSSADFPAAAIPGRTYTWHFGDGTSASGFSVGHTYLTPGRYLPWVEVADPACGTVVRIPAGTVVVGPSAGCTEAADCKDGNPCTKGDCDTGTCKHAIVDGCCDDVPLCEDGLVCTQGGCVPGSGCVQEAIGECDEPQGGGCHFEPTEAGGTWLNGDVKCVGGEDACPDGWSCTKNVFFCGCLPDEGLCGKLPSGLCVGGCTGGQVCNAECTACVSACVLQPGLGDETVCADGCPQGMQCNAQCTGCVGQVEATLCTAGKVGGCDDKCPKGFQVASDKVLDTKCDAQCNHCKSTDATFKVCTFVPASPGSAIGVCEDSCPKAEGYRCDDQCKGCVKADVPCYHDVFDKCVDACPEGMECSAECTGCVPKEEAPPPAPCAAAASAVVCDFPPMDVPLTVVADAPPVAGCETLTGVTVEITYPDPGTAAPVKVTFKGLFPKSMPQMVQVVDGAAPSLGEACSSLGCAASVTLLPVIAGIEIAMAGLLVPATHVVRLRMPAGTEVSDSATIELDCDTTKDFCPPGSDGEPCPDEGKACTKGECQGGTCIHVDVPGCCAADAECGDGDPCNGAETCVENACKPGAPLTCSPESICHTATCKTKIGCVQVLIDGCKSCTTEADCSDGNACNGVEPCSQGKCGKGFDPNCNDNDPCTIDDCSPSEGCTNVKKPNCCGSDAACADSDMCTTDGCDFASSTCYHSPKSCDDKKPCTTDTCLAADGTCNNIAVAEDTPCTGGTCNAQGACVPTDTGTGVCAAAPAVTCATAVGTQVVATVIAATPDTAGKNVALVRIDAAGMIKQGAVQIGLSAPANSVGGFLEMFQAGAGTCTKVPGFVETSGQPGQPASVLLRVQSAIPSIVYSAPIPVQSASVGQTLTLTVTSVLCPK